MKANQLTAIVLTRNESIHIERCIRSLQRVAGQIFVIDSFSSDDTVHIAESLGAIVVQNTFVNHSRQLNWALENCDINSEWIIRLDADEFLTDELVDELNTVLPTVDHSVTGLSTNYRHYFWGRWIRHGTRYPLTLLRIWRTGYGFADGRWMDEKIQLTEGKIVKLKHDFIHEDLNTLTFFIDKHNGYATREAIELLRKKHALSEPNFGFAPVVARHFNVRVKDKFYSRPYLLWVRSFIYFIYRYIFRLGFLDGRPGLAYHFLQGFWFRFLADMKCVEIEKIAKERSMPIDKAIEFYKTGGTSRGVAHKAKAITSILH